MDRQTGREFALYYVVIVIQLPPYPPTFHFIIKINIPRYLRKLSTAIRTCNIQKISINKKPMSRLCKYKKS